jgi:hypothetical protein
MVEFRHRDVVDNCRLSFGKDGSFKEKTKNKL